MILFKVPYIGNVLDTKPANFTGIQIGDMYKNKRYYIEAKKLSGFEKTRYTVVTQFKKNTLYAITRLFNKTEMYYQYANISIKVYKNDQVIGKFNIHSNVVPIVRNFIVLSMLYALNKYSKMKFLYYGSVPTAVNAIEFKNHKDKDRLDKLLNLNLLTVDNLTCDVIPGKDIEVNIFGSAMYVIFYNNNSKQILVINLSKRQMFEGFPIDTEYEKGSNNTSIWILSKNNEVCNALAREHYYTKVKKLTLITWKDIVNED